MSSEQPVKQWIRTRRLSRVRMERSATSVAFMPGGRDWVTGPWHVLTDIGQTWCGKKMRGVAMQRQNSDPPEDEQRCRSCEVALAQDRPRAYKRR